MAYRPVNLRVNKIVGGFRLMDADLNMYEDAELCRCGEEGDIPANMKKEFLDWIVHVVKKYCKTKTKGQCDRCGEEDILEVLDLDPALGLGNELSLCWECYCQALVSGVQSWHTRKESSESTSPAETPTQSS